MTYLYGKSGINRVSERAAEKDCRKFVIYDFEGNWLCKGDAAPKDIRYLCVFEDLP